MNKINKNSTLGNSIIDEVNGIVDGEVVSDMSDINSEKIWGAFAKDYNLSSDQLNMFKRYYFLLKSTNKLHNLTAITDLQSVVDYHFKDSLALCKLLECSKISNLVDVGTGAGFPGIPLKILNPHMNLTLVEVNQKKVKFLNNLIQEFDLSNCEVIDLDWRNFLRQEPSNGQDNIYTFCARASLSPDELIRVFKPSSNYKNSQLIYWASKKWMPEPNQNKFIKKEIDYKVGDKVRKLVLFKSS